MGDVYDGYHDIGHAFNGREDAEDFARCEVGAPCKIYRRVDGVYVILVADNWDSEE
jgi:hypothetical protein